MMRVGNLFEAWAWEHVAFEQTNKVWPYLMEDKIVLTQRCSSIAVSHSRSG